MTEINALKPGNVSRYVDGHGMSYEDFKTSAMITTPILCNPQYSVGKRVLHGVIATQNAVACNTNLGMLLLYAPIIKTVQDLGSLQTSNNIAQQLKVTLAALHKDDADQVFEAIRLANPGGLGQVEHYDVHFDSTVGLNTAMQAAADKDLIARQYVTGYESIFSIGLKCLHEYVNRWNHVEWAAVACYLTYMAKFPDTHIQRKFGIEIAEQTKIAATRVLKQFNNNENPADAMDMLLELDTEFKKSKINPGTSADLTAASLLIYNLT